MSKKLKERGLRVIGVIYEDPSISLSWLEGKLLEGIKANKDIIRAIKRLEQYVKGKAR